MLTNTYLNEQTKLNACFKSRWNVIARQINDNISSKFDLADFFLWRRLLYDNKYVLYSIICWPINVTHELLVQILMPAIRSKPKIDLKQNALSVNGSTFWLTISIRCIEVNLSLLSEFITQRNLSSLVKDLSRYMMSVLLLNPKVHEFLLLYDYVKCANVKT